MTTTPLKTNRQHPQKQAKKKKGSKLKKVVDNLFSIRHNPLIKTTVVMIERLDRATDFSFAVA